MVESQRFCHVMLGVESNWWPTYHLNTWFLSHLTGLGLVVSLRWMKSSSSCMGILQSHDKDPHSPTRCNGMSQGLCWNFFFAANSYCSFLQQKALFFFCLGKFESFLNIGNHIQPFCKHQAPLGFFWRKFVWDEISNRVGHGSFPPPKLSGFTPPKMHEFVP